MMSVDTSEIQVNVDTENNSETITIEPEEKKSNNVGSMSKTSETKIVDSSEVDWDSVNVQTKKDLTKQSEVSDLPIIGHKEAISTIFEEFKKSQDKDIQESGTKKRSKFATFFRKVFPYFFKTELKSKELEIEKKMVEKSLKIELDLKNELHCRLLFSIYRSLKKSDVNPPLVGDHWVDVGFQRENPKTDLRGSGIFGLIQLLSFSNRNGKYSRKVYNGSVVKMFQFPYACVSLNWTSVCLSLLKNGKLNKIINQENSVVEGLCLAHLSLFYRFYKEWDSKKLNISKYGELKQTITEESRKKITKFIREYQKFSAVEV